jgi:hypothetical protein
MVKTPGRAIAAAVLIAVQAALQLLAAGALLASAHRLHRWLPGTEVAHHRAELGLLLLVVAVVALAVAIGVATMSAWARVAAIVFEVLVVVGHLVRAGRHPYASVLGVLFAVVVIALVAQAERPNAAATGGVEAAR